MADKVKNAEGVEAAANVEGTKGVDNNPATKKVSRRGVGSARGTQRLRFSHEMANSSNGLFLGHLDTIAVSSITIGEDKTGMPSFNGLEVPRIVITFASNEAEIVKRKYINLQFTAVESNAETIPGGKGEWKINAVFDWFKHILNVYVLKGRELTEAEEAALSLSYEDFDEQGEYVPVDAEVVLEAWKVLFENFENLLSRGKDGQPTYKSKDGKDLTVWIKMLRYQKNRKKGWVALNNGELSLPTFVGEGCIELFKQNTAPSIRVNSINEAIIPMNVDKPKAPNMGIPNMGGPMGGVPLGDTSGMPTGFGDNTNAGFGSEDDLPF